MARREKKEIINVGDFSKAIVKPLDYQKLWYGTYRQAYEVVIKSHDDTDEVEYKTVVGAYDAEGAARWAFEEYLNN